MSKNYILIDNRTPEEFAFEHVEGALNIDLYSTELNAELSKLDKTKTYKVYCRSGNRSGQVMRIMKNMGFSDVENLGGVSAAAETLGLDIVGE